MLFQLFVPYVMWLSFGWSARVSLAVAFSPPPVASSDYYCGGDEVRAHRCCL